MGDRQESVEGEECPRFGERVGVASWEEHSGKDPGSCAGEVEKGECAPIHSTFPLTPSSFQALAVPQGTQASASPTWPSSRPIHLQGQQPPLAPCSIHRVASVSLTSQPMRSQALPSALRTRLPLPTGTLLHVSVPLHMLFPAPRLPCPTTPLLSLVNSGARPHTHHIQLQSSPFWNALSRSVYHQLHSAPLFGLPQTRGQSVCVGPVTCSESALRLGNRTGLRE